MVAFFPLDGMSATIKKNCMAVWEKLYGKNCMAQIP